MLGITAQAGPERGETLLRLDFNAPAEREAWSRNPAAKWNEEPPGAWRLSVDAAGDRAGANMVSRPVDLAPWRGMVLRFECEARAEDVSPPAQPYNGVKFMLHVKSPGGELWRNQDHLHGTFDWRKIGSTWKSRTTRGWGTVPACRIFDGPGRLPRRLPCGCGCPPRRHVRPPTPRRLRPTRATTRRGCAG
ncbi:MAG: hypothetical protein U1F77_19820 [Kiritimatiellia bacterium]